VLPVQAGEILIDGRALSPETRPAWQTKIGYVPQTPFLIDDTVARNIAFGIPDDEIDPQRLREAAEAACIQSFIETELPNAYDTLIGDQGMSLSGGQQQRLAIARAVYRRPELIVLDEATSALDNVTEAIVSEAIANLAHKMTVVIVAHRLSTVRNCDRIVVLEEGRVVQCGTLEQLSSEHGAFKRQMESGQLAAKS
jgi:ABC-type multidrug transport system fused ATPase/permease subunit